MEKLGEEKDKALDFRQDHHILAGLLNNKDQKEEN